MFDYIYNELAKRFYFVNYDDYIIVDEKEYKKRLINGNIDELQRKIYESKCFCDKDFLKRIIEMHSCFYNYMPDEYKMNYSFIIELVNINPNIYKYLKLKRDDKVLRIVLKLNPFMMLYAPRDIKDNEEYVLLTLNKENKIVRYASDRLKEKYDTYSSSEMFGRKIYM